MIIKNLLTFLATFFLFFTSSLKANEKYLKLNYGISNNEVNVTATKGTIITDEEDSGFIISAGSMIGDFWGFDLTYYDLGSSSLKVDSGEIITQDKVNYVVESSGTITNNISGYGIGLILSNTQDESQLINLYIKGGIHSWDKSGNTTILDNDNAFSGKFYNAGIGSYGGIGSFLNIYDNIFINIAYDIIGLSNNASFTNSSSLLSGGIKVNF